MVGDAFVDISDTFHRRIPSAFQLACDKSLGWIDSLIAAGGNLGFIARFLELPAIARRTSSSDVTDRSAAKMVVSKACSEIASTI